MQNDWEWFNNNPEIKKLMQHTATQGYYFILYYMYYVSSASSVYAGLAFGAPIMDMILPLNETREKIPSFPTNYGIDGEKYFILLGIHGFIVNAMAMAWLWTTDAFIIMMVYHCSSLFNIVGVLLQQLNMKNCNYDEQYEKKIITEAIIVHKYAIEFAEFIEKSVTKVYGFIFMVNMIMMSITGFYAVLNFEKRKSEAIRMALFTVSQGIHLFLNTIPSQCIINSSESVFHAVYNCKWDELSIKSKNLLNIMLTRSSRPYTLTAGKFYPVNFENFGNIIKTSLSYLTVLNSMQ
ncbi:hypothetical protein HCN44_001064 [Aphidius gifuensis]|uniref:Odorant receptor n=1 Tax=Aphidius gifuensis TaxID=684658 RepID=A0A834XM21_APHGI|nr:hypothetical protein HCN44_001064 [Aphidius gifuensis]